LLSLTQESLKADKVISHLLDADVLVKCSVSGKMGQLGDIT
jgi:hypothetical protein